MKKSASIEVKFVIEIIDTSSWKTNFWSHETDGNNDKVQAVTWAVDQVSCIRIVPCYPCLDTCACPTMLEAPSNPIPSSQSRWIPHWLRFSRSDSVIVAEAVAGKSTKSRDNSCVAAISFAADLFNKWYANCHLFCHRYVRWLICYDTDKLWFI